MRTLLIVTSDDCVACQATLANWKELIASLPVGRLDEVIIASQRGTRIAAELASLAKARGFRGRALAVVQQAAFALATGLTLTPTTVILDRDARLRYLAHALPPPVREDLVDEWQSLERASPVLTGSRPAEGGRPAPAFIAIFTAPIRVN
ncbi:MAG: hypothetical protein AB7N29_04850 [Vicinamibacterales bacterium]